MRTKKQFCPLGLAIEHYQNEAFISTYRMAAISGVTEATLSNLKNGKTNPSIDTLERIAKVLDVPLSGIIKRKEAIEMKVARA